MSKKNKKLKQSGAPRSKQARQKLRRWSFEAEFKLENGQIRIFHLPGLVYGNSAEAKATADELLAKFKSDPTAPQDVTVNPVGHETVSPVTKKQLQGLNDTANLANKALFVLAERYRLASGTDKELVQIVSEVYEEARKVLFPRLEEAADKVEALEASLTQAEESGTKRKIGIDAVNEALGRPPAEL